MTKMLSALFLICIFIGCAQEDNNPNPCCEPEPECHAAPAPIYYPGTLVTGRVDGFKNCIPFRATAYSFVGDDATNLTGLGINTYEDWGNFLANKEVLSVGVAAHTLGNYPFLKNLPHANYIYYYTFQDHDVAEDLYRIDTNYSNVMTIASIDTSNDHVTGTFDCRFIIVPPGHGKNPDTIIFTDCYFDAHE
jgi:hypothetical protein